MATTTESVAEVCRAAKEASYPLAALTTETKNKALSGLADRLEARVEEILEANGADLEAAREAGLDAALIDRLALDRDRIAAIATGVRDIVALPDPVGEVIEGKRLENGLEMRTERVPIGVIAIVYEARPNVTVDAAALCLKSGNAVVLRGSSIAERSNAVLAGIVRDAIRDAGLPEAAVGLIAGGDRSETAELATQEDTVDLIIPRGGEGLKAALKEVATVPVIYAASGNCHVYVHSDADPEMAVSVVHNAKVQRPGVCNAAETLLVHESLAGELLPRILADLHGSGVELVGDERTRAAAGETPVGEATDADWDTEYHALKMSVGVVESLDEAIQRINHHGSGHSEAIITSSEEAAKAFTDTVDAAAVFVNTSTRFHDGYEFGMGAEIGTSTQKLHARGTIGIRELTTTKYVVHGEGQVRE
ncbi:MAG: glutamate-5-semialdehyde dehydrogenase [Solirubrobacterales bacterium]